MEGYDEFSGLYPDTIPSCDLKYSSKKTQIGPRCGETDLPVHIRVEHYWKRSLSGMQTAKRKTVRWMQTAFPQCFVSQHVSSKQLNQHAGRRKIPPRERACVILSATHIDRYLFPSTHNGGVISLVSSLRLRNCDDFRPRAKRELQKLRVRQLNCSTNPLVIVTEYKLT
jgi:hypothetical protein